MPRQAKKIKRKILLELEDCRDCPKHRTDRTPNSGYAYDIFCTIVQDEDGNDMKSSGYVEWESEVNPVPDWCPLLHKE